ncbi:replication associated protein [Chicken smacovirus mg5_1081]|uniref:Replication associated protein n=1 Tax=Chicken smacovirus mg5_1081 TaxID=2720961 RepID=A0A6G9W2H8_9VIRU|nr:replication associated protein [Chicken smacovirus mg5_1081]QIR82269.1 replication associated protein [Chicken smacovirus mg5_1081]
MQPDEQKCTTVYKMVTLYMLTIPQTYPKRAIKLMIELNDCKKWVVAKETGRGGYKHWQIRLATSNPEFFVLEQKKIVTNDGIEQKVTIKKGWLPKNIPEAHCEECNDVWDYERKEGNFWTSEDTDEVRRVRFGKLRPIQRDILAQLNQQGDRQIDVWLDKSGNHGKTWLSQHLYERGEAMVVPRSSCSPEKLSAYVCSAYRGEGIIIIDIPRSRKISPELYESIEELKDGLVFDHRYSGRCRNIRGVKVLIFTNTELDTKKLSHDRWRLHGISKDTNALQGATAHPPRGPPLKG